MPALDPINTTNRQLLPLDSSRGTKAIASAEKIRMTEAVPGSTDNDSDSWRRYLQVGRGSIEVIPDDDPLPDVSARPDTKLIIHQGELWRKGSVDGAQISGRFRLGTAVNHRDQTVYGVTPGQIGQYISNPNNAFWVIGYVGTTLQLWIAETAYETAKGSAVALSDALRVTFTTDEDTPRTGFIDLTYQGQHVTGIVDIEFIEFTATKAGLPLDAAAVGHNVEFSLTRGGAAFLQAPTSHEGWVVLELAGVQRNAQDLENIQNELTDVARIIVVPDSDPLPPTTDYSAEQIIYHQGEFLHKGAVSGVAAYSATFRSGQYTFGGRTAYGVARNSYGQWLINPSSRFFAMVHAARGSSNVVIKASDYVAAKGSALDSEDTISVTLTTSEDTPRTATAMLTYSHTELALTTSYYSFSSSVRQGFGGVLDADSVDFEVTMALSRGGSPFLHLAEDHEGWVPVEFEQSQLNFQAIDDLRRELFEDEGGINQQLNNLETRMEGQEDRTLDIELQDEEDWQEATNTPVNGVYPYGVWEWPRPGNRTVSYQGRDYPGDFETSPSESGFSGSGAGLIWILPNNINWSRVRLVVRRADGSVRSSITGQSLRNAPATLVVDGVPTTPEHTVRWSASSDTQPYAVSNIDPTDTITLEDLDVRHTPIWAGPIDPARLAALVLLVDDEAAYDAIASPDPNRLYLW